MKNVKIKIHYSEDYISVYFINNKTNKYMALAMAECSIIDRINGVYYFNRLFVGQPYRRKGYGSKILQVLLDIVNKHNNILLLDINPYNDIPYMNMSYEDLEKFYIKHGFKKYIMTQKETDIIYCSYIYINKGANMININNINAEEIIFEKEFCINDKIIKAYLYEDDFSTYNIALITNFSKPLVSKYNGDILNSDSIIKTMEQLVHDNYNDF